MKAGFGLRLSFLAGLIVLVSCFSWPRCLRGEPGRSADEKALYDPDAGHLWNRLHRTLFVRTGPDGVGYGLDELDPLLWVHTRYLLEGPSHENAVKVLDEFLDTHGETLIGDPIKRAVLQRDLWAVFDWTTLWPVRDSPLYQARRSLQWRLATMMHRLALTKEQIAGLQDNYAAAAACGEFAPAYDERKPAVPFLPPGLYSTNGPY